MALKTGKHTEIAAQDAYNGHLSVQNPTDRQIDIFYQIDVFIGTVAPAC